MALTSPQIPVFYNTIRVDGNWWASGDSAVSVGSDTNGKAIYTPTGSVGGRVTSLIVSSTDSAAKVLVLYLFKTSGSVVYPLGSLSIPANSGTDGSTAIVDLLSETNGSRFNITNQGKRFIDVPAGFVLKAGFTTTLTVGKNIYVNCIGADV